MNGFRNLGLERLSGWGRRSLEFARSRRARRIATWIVAMILVLGIATFFAVPMVLRSVLTGTVAKQLKRPVTVGKIGFNLYTLRLDIDKLHIGEPEGSQPFVDVGHLRVRAGWSSLFRLAPVVKEVTVTAPAIHVVRTGEQQFNFSDLLQSPNPPPPPPKETAPSKPLRFAVSNIRLIDGDIHFDDQVLNQQHRIEHIQLGVPFIANLPADVDIYVQPLLQMVIDGSPLRIVGRAKPFANPPESVVDLRLHRLELQRYLAYAPKQIAIKIPQGTLSTDVQLHFVNAATEGARPHISLSGPIALDDLGVRDSADAPLIDLQHAVVKLGDVEPLDNLIALREIWIDGLVLHPTLNADGSNNFAAIMGTPAPTAGGASATPSASPTPSATAAPLTQGGATPTATAAGAMNVSLDAFEMVNSAVKLADHRNPTPNNVSLDDIHVTMHNFHLAGAQTPAPYEVSAKLGSGGTISVKGGVDLGQSEATSEVALEQIDLPGLQGFAHPAFVGNLASGKLGVHAKLAAHFGNAPFNLHVEPGNIAIADLKIDDPKHETPVQWKNFSVAVAQADLATHNAVVSEVRSDAINLLVRRGKKGELNLASLVQSAPPPPPPPPSPKKPRRKREAKRAATPTPQASPGSSWTYKVESVALENTAARVIDESMPRKADLNVAPLNIHLKNVSEDLAKPITLDVAGTLNKKGTFNVTGTLAPIPLKANLQVVTDKLNLAPADPFISGKLNATITSAALTMKGAVGLDNSRKDFLVSYKGDVTLGSVMVLDKLTRDPFVQWRSLNVTRINVKAGEGPLYAHIGAIALDDFYARIILRQNGTLNVNDVVAKEQAAPTSLTRTEQPPGAAPAPIAPTPSAPAGPAADLEIGKITLARGHVNYSDSFIQPNYSADLTDINGKIGKFGTGTTEPAEVLVDGKVNGSSPLEISGMLNPLAPKASLDITAKADGVELTGLTPYSSTYAGYPITRGTLTVNVHYVLKDEQLTAENHILLDQLTFGDPLPGAKPSKIPLRLAIALLKDSKGQIDLNIPVSGSLNDPQFSVFDVVIGALKNIILKAATAPFNLLASAIPNFGGNAQQLSHVDFAPGFATLTDEDKKSLDTLASALKERPALRLSIEGRVDPAFDRDGLREAKLLNEMKAAKARKKGESGDVESVELTPSERDKYLARVYKDATFDKPKDFVGLDKSLPPEEMKKLLLAHTQVSDQDLQRLADARAAAVRKYMSDKVEPGRLFLSASKLTPEGINDKGKTTRVDLSFD